MQNRKLNIIIEELLQQHDVPYRELDTRIEEYDDGHVTATQALNESHDELLHIYNCHMLWVADLQGLIRGELKEHRTKRTIVLDMLSSAMFQHCLAIKILAQSGLNTQLRVLARVLVETVDMYLAATYDPSFAEKYHSAIEDNEARQFWKDSIAYGKIDLKITEIWRLHKILDSEVQLIQRRRQEVKNSLSADVHSSAMSVMFSAAHPVLGTELYNATGVPMADARTPEDLKSIIWLLVDFAYLALAPTVKQGRFTDVDVFRIETNSDSLHNLAVEAFVFEKVTRDYIDLKT